MSDSVTPPTAAHQATLSFTVSQSLLKLMFTESVMPSNYLILCHPLLLLPQSFPASGSFPMNQLFASGGQRTGASALASVLPMNIQDWFSLGWTGLILLSKGLLRVFSSTILWKHQFFSAQPSLWANSHIHKWLLEKPQHWLYRSLLEKWYLCLFSLGIMHVNIHSYFYNLRSPGKKVRLLQGSLISDLYCWSTWCKDSEKHYV